MTTPYYSSTPKNSLTLARNNRLLYLLSIVLLIASNGIMIFKLSLSNKGSNINYNKNYQFLESKISYIESQWINSIKNYQIADTVQLEDYYEQKIPITSIINDITIVFRFNEFDCNECIEFALAKIKKLETNSISNIVILIDTKTEENLHTYQNIYAIKSPIYKANNLPQYTSGNSMPYFFTIDKNLNISNIIIPDKGYPDIADKYINQISTLL